jgi:hypothetical protein
MARIFFDGFDHGSMKLWDGYSGTLDNTSKVTGVYSLPYNCYCYKNTSRTDIYDVYFGLWFKVPLSVASSYFSVYPAFEQYSVFPNGFRISVSSSKIYFYVYSDPGGYTLNLGSADLSYSENNLQIRFKNNQSSPATVLVQIKFNGALVVNETVSDYGYPLYYCPSAVAGNYFTRFYIVGETSNTGIYLDDIVIDDADWPGPSKIYTLAPNGAGNSTMWQPSAGSNYACVDDIPENTSDYVMADDALDLDLYALENLPAEVSSVKGVQVLALAKTPGSPAYEYLQLALRTNSVNYFSSSKILYYAYNLLMNFWDSNPNTGSEWTVSQVNALEAGVRLVSS